MVFYVHSTSAVVSGRYRPQENNNPQTTAPKTPPPLRTHTHTHTHTHTRTHARTQNNNSIHLLNFVLAKANIHLFVYVCIHAHSYFNGAFPCTPSDTDSQLPANQHGKDLRHVQPVAEPSAPTPPQPTPSASHHRLAALAP